ncbi:MAG: hypothetical protein HDR10_01415 [Lachnospiraceae bacterium]|nr:hypothetical protein [Lachnospiraceae bacterium]
MEILFFALIIGIALAVSICSGSSTKRGCGGGCATCGNRKVCHRKREGKWEEDQ